MHITLPQTMLQPASLHTAHHDQSLMSNYHFNITYPIMDWVMGTLHKP